MLLESNQQTQKFCHLLEKLDLATTNKKVLDALKYTRIVKFDLVYVSGIPYSMANKKILKGKQFLGKYGKIKNLYISKGFAFNNKSKRMTCHVEYSNPQEATLAIASLNGLQCNDRKLSASYGLTRYCCYFLQSQHCPQNKCQYVHKIIKNQYTYDKRHPKQQEIIDKIVNLELSKNLLKVSKKQIFNENPYSFFPITNLIETYLMSQSEQKNNLFKKKRQSIQANCQEFNEQNVIFQNYVPHFYQEFGYQEIIPEIQYDFYNNNRSRNQFNCKKTNRYWNTFQ